LDAAHLDVYYNPSFSSQNGSVYIDRTALPVHGLGNVTLTTAGGTSAPLVLNELRVNVNGTYLGDVAVDADGKIWVTDYANPGKLQQIDPASGQILNTIDYTAAYGTTYTYNHAGLQVLGAAMTLGSTNVPAGSLLVFNGYVNPDRVIAVNPANGAVLATLTLAGNYDLTAGVYDASTGKIFITESSPGNRMLQINAATGALEAAITVPINASSWAGLAISPLNGNLWIGAYGGTVVVEITRTGTEVRRVDLAAQGVNNNEISGLSFLPDGRLLVASTHGVVYRVDLP
jgi:ligand-binding sensor domain-containing protein